MPTKPMGPLHYNFHLGNGQGTALLAVKTNFLEKQHVLLLRNPSSPISFPPHTVNISFKHSFFLTVQKHLLFISPNKHLTQYTPCQQFLMPDECSVNVLKI